MHWNLWDPKSSTKELAKINKNFLKFLHGYLYLRFTPEYIDFLDKTKKRLTKLKGGLPQSVDEMTSRWYSRSHHSKVLTAPQAKDLVTLEEEVHLHQLEQVLPFDKAINIVLTNPDQIAVTDCPCRELVANPCGPLDVCLVVGEPLASFVLDHKVRNARKISQDEAANLLERERERGRIHTAWFKDALGERFYAICNCCRCCCAGLKAYLDYDVKMVVSSGYTAEINDDCDVCGRCQEACFFGAVRLDQELKRPKVTVERDMCMGCGLCLEACPQGAISLKLDPNKPKPLEVKKTHPKTSS